VVMGRIRGTLPPLPSRSSWSEAGYFVKFFMYDAVNYVSVPSSGRTCFVPSLMQRVCWINNTLQTDQVIMMALLTSQHVSECEADWTLPVTFFPQILAIRSGKELWNDDRKDRLSFILPNVWVTIDGVCIDNWIYGTLTDRNYM
jgi:hypothetical protein